MNGQANFLRGGTVESSVSLLFTIDTSKGVGTSFTIPTANPSETYNYDVLNWGDGSSNTGLTGNASHTYSVDGIYQIEIIGKFPKFHFNNSGDKLKIIAINRWGSIDWSTNQNYVFYGCSNLTSVADDAEWMNEIISAYRMFQSTKVTSFSDVVTFENIIDGRIMFYGVPINYLTDSVTFANLGNGQQMFQNSGILAMPPLVKLSNAYGLSSFWYHRPMTTARYSQLLIDLDNLNPNNNVVFTGQYAYYNSSAVTARANLISRGWTITDFGLE